MHNDENVGLKGTDNYRAPEILHGGKCTDHSKADIFSLGVVLFLL